jgi:hypothetical protein
LAQRLLASLEEDTEIEEAWAQEVERRIAEVESGAVQLTGRVQFVGRRIVSSMQTTVESKGSE